MTGNNIFIFIIISTYIPQIICTNLRNAELKGGLIFEQDRLDPIMVNPKYLLYHRYINLDEIFKAANVMKDFTEAYEHFCAQIDNVLAEEFTHVFVPHTDMARKYFVSTEKSPLSNAPIICSTQGYRPVEIRTISEYTHLQTFAKKNNVTYIYSGITINNTTGRLMFRSDRSEINQIFDGILYSIDKTSLPRNSPPWDPAVKYYWKETPNALYIMNTVARQLILMQNEVNKIKDKIICEKTSFTPLERKQNEFLLQITAHVCKRDIQDMKNMVKLMNKEISLFKNVDTPQKDAPQTINICPAYDCVNCKHIAHMQFLLSNFSTNMEPFVRLPKEIIEKYIVFKILGLSKIDDFKRFLQYNFTRPYISKTTDILTAKTEQLMYSLICHLHGHIKYNESFANSIAFDKLKFYQFYEIIADIRILLTKIITPIKVKRWATYQRYSDEAFPALDPISFSNWDYWIFNAYHIKDFTNMHKVVKSH